MPDPIKLITRRVEEMTYKAVDKKAQFVWGRVLSRNPDGTLNIDDGKGGCILIIPPMNARTGDMVHVALGAMIGGPNMPGLAAYSANVPQTNHLPPAVFIDDAGNIYDGSTGAAKGSGGTPTADVNSAFGYSFSSPNCFAGASPSYADLQIGVVDVSGYQGETYGANNTVLCQGVGLSNGILLGIEIANTSPATTLWTVQLRDATTFEIITTNTASYLHNWIATHLDDFFDGIDTNWDVHVSADP